ncbi:MAG: hypothetical protein LRY55_12845 [Leadbetterella sp.]|nr:hypothetical protein [Leadbetterella sp.]
MNFNQYTHKAQELIQQAVQIAQGYSQQVVETGHLLKAILEEEPDTASFLLKNADRETLPDRLVAVVEAYPRVSGSTQPYIGNELSKAFAHAQGSLKEFGDEYVSVELLLLGILKGSDRVAALLKSAGIKEAEFKERIKRTKRKK